MYIAVLQCGSTLGPKTNALKKASTENDGYVLCCVHQLEANCVELNTQLAKTD